MVLSEMSSSEWEIITLEQIASGDQLKAVLSSLCAILEHRVAGARALFLLVNEYGPGATVAAAPSFDTPPGERSVLALLRTVQEVSASVEIAIEDVARLATTDVGWADVHALGVEALVALPVLDPDLKLLGVFVLTYGDRRPVASASLEILRHYTPLAGIAIRTDQRERALARSREAIREAQRIGRFGDLTVHFARGDMTWSEETYRLYERPSSSNPPSIDEFIALHAGPSEPALEQAFRGQGPVKLDVEVRVTLPSGERGHHRFLLSRVTTASGMVKLTGTVHDITERRRSEDALHHAQRLESLGLLASGIAHDFNNLLTALRANVGLIDRDLPRGSPSRPALDAIDAITVQAAAMIRQMLSYAGRGSAKEEVIVFDALVRDAANLLIAAIPKHIEIGLRLDAGDGTMLGDTIQIRQVVMNLLTNAVDAIGERQGAVTVATSVHDIGASEIARRFPGQSMSEGRFFVLEVEDDGQGMDSETVSRVFDPFFTTKATGRGLGLSAVRGILRAHGAGFEIDSVLDRGTRFLVAFPAITARAPQ